MRSARLLVTVAALGVVVGACRPSQPAETTTTTLATTTTSVLETTTTVREPFVYRVGLPDAPTTFNFWAFYDPQSSLVDQYVLGPTKPSLYTYEYPGLEPAADLAAGAEVPTPVEDGDTWTVTVEMRRDARWSDGVPITAEDVAFTFRTVRDLGLTRGWAAAYPVVEEGDETLGLLDVEAVDRDTVLFRFNGRPGLPFWPNGPGTAPIMPRHFWEPSTLDLSEGAELFALSGEGDPSGGPFVVNQIGVDLVTALPNENYQRAGEQVTSGSVSYEIGPFFDAMEFRVFPDEASAVQGMADDEVDVVLSPIGLDRTLAEAATAVPFFDVVSNETNGFRYLAFNLRREPMAQQAFRDALGLMVDRQYLANQVLSGGAFPAYTSISPANPIWYDGEIAESLEERTADLTTEQRLSEAIRLLEDSGFTWERRPEFADNAVVAGQGVAFADEPVAPLRILAPGQAFDPLRATYALWIREWLVQLGFDVEVELTDFTTLVNQVFTPTSDGALDYDMFVLGWRLPSPAMPVHHESFWAAKNDTLANNGNNNTGFDDDRFNAFVEEYNAAATFEEAFDLLWEMERIVFEEKPYLVLFDTGITEAYRNDRVSFPFTRTISGIQSLNGMPALVRPAS